MITCVAVLALCLVATASDAGQSRPAREHIGGSIRGNAAAAFVHRPSDSIAGPPAGRSPQGYPNCYAQVAPTRNPIRFSSSLHARGGSVSLTISHYRLPTMLTQSPACAPSVVAGHTYSASLSYRSTTSAIGLEILSDTSSGWHTWYAVPVHLAAKRGFGKVSVVLAPIDVGVERIAFGVLMHARGTVQVEDLSLSDLSRPSRAPTPAPSTTVGLPAIPASPSPSPATNPPTQTPPVEPEPGPPVKTPPVGEEAPCEKLPEVHPPTEKTTYVEPSGEPSKVGRWTVREGVENARTIHAVLLQNGKLLLMAGSGNDRMEFARGCFRSYIYNPDANTWKEIKTPKDVFCAGHVQLANGNVLIVGGTKAYPPAPKNPGEFPSTVYEGENTSWIFNIRTEQYEKVKYDEADPNNSNEPGPLLNGAWYPSATELGDGDVISFGGLNEEGKGATQTNYYIDESNGADSAGDQLGEWVGWGSPLLQQTYDWFWGLYPSMILTADGRLFYDGGHVFGNGLDRVEISPGVFIKSPQAPEGSSLYDFYCTPGKTQKENEEEANDTNPEAKVVGPKVAGGPASEDETHPRVESTPGLEDPNQRDQSASLLLPPAQKQEVMIMGGGNTYETGTPAIDSTDEIDLEESKPEWKAGPDLPQGVMDNGEPEEPGMGKMYVSAVALPDGTVLETGGSEAPAHQRRARGGHLRSGGK